MRPSVLFVAVAALLAGTACRVDRRPEESSRPTAPRADILGSFWFIPGSHVTDTTGTAEAQRKELRIAMPLDTVRAVYRQRMRELGWTVVSDQGDTARVAMYVRKDSSNVWIDMTRGAPGVTLYTVIGARQTRDSAGPQMLPPRN